LARLIMLMVALPTLTILYQPGLCPEQTRNRGLCMRASRYQALSRRPWGPILRGTVLYGLLSWLTHAFPLAADPGIQIRPAVAIPICYGFIFGPLVGFCIGMFGNVLGDLLSGTLVAGPPTGDALRDMLLTLNVSWHIGNGLMGMLPGLLTWRHRRYRTLHDHLLVLGAIALAVIVGMSASIFLSSLLQGGTSSIAWLDTLIGVAGLNLLLAVLLVPIVLLNYEHLDLAAIHWRTSVLLRRFALVLVLTAGLPIVLLAVIVLLQPGALGLPATTLVGNVVFTIILIVLFTVANAALLTQSLTRPLVRLTQAATQIEAGELTDAQTTELQATAGSDELARLSRVFGRMAHEVIQREVGFRQEITQLRIEIDVVKRQRQVDSITETDFFRDLQQRARQMRQRSAPAPDRLDE
jgi:hypothetical protein